MHEAPSRTAPPLPLLTSPVGGIRKCVGGGLEGVLDVLKGVLVGVSGYVRECSKSVLVGEKDCPSLPHSTSSE